MAEHFLHSVMDQTRLSTEVMDALARYKWPGNIRELANVIEQMAALCDGSVITPEHLPPKIINEKPLVIDERNTAVAEEQVASSEQDTVEKRLEEIAERLDNLVDQIDVRSGFDLPLYLDKLKEITNESARKLISKALQEAGGRYPQAAEWLTTTPRILRYLYKEKK